MSKLTIALLTLTALLLSQSTTRTWHFYPQPTKDGGLTFFFENPPAPTVDVTAVIRDAGATKDCTLSGTIDTSGANYADPTLHADIHSGVVVLHMELKFSDRRALVYDNPVAGKVYTF